MNESVIIIGGGIGGLFTGAFLARNGLKVTVLEKNSIIGGGLQCFARRGKTFETGMHIMGGFEPGGSIYKICRYLGILDKLDIHHIDSRCMDEIRFNSTGEVFRIASGREGFTASLAGYFPDEAENIRAYVDCLYAIADEVPLFHLRPSDGSLAPHSELFTIPADKLIARFISDPRLRELLAYLNPLYGGVEGHTPAYIHALIYVLYINGASRFAGGSQQLADALAAIIRDNGGAVLASKEVCRIEVKEKMATEVATTDGSVYKADRYISAIHPVEMLRLVSEGAFLRGFVKRLNEIPNSYSAFSLFIDLKPGVFPYIDHTCYFMEDYGTMWSQAEQSADTFPQGFMYMTPPDREQGKYASRMLVHCIMGFDEVRRWENTTPGRRGAEYEAWKQERIERVTAKLNLLFPGFDDMAAHIYAASPLTVRDYYHTKEGALFGYRKDSDNPVLTQIPVYTKVRNLLLTGQNINLHGICGVPLTAINTAAARLCTNTLINLINDANKDI